MNFFVHVTADRVELIGPTHRKQLVRRRQVAGVSPDKVTVEITRLGGGGRRLKDGLCVEVC